MSEIPFNPEHAGKKEEKLGPARSPEAFDQRGEEIEKESAAKALSLADEVSYLFHKLDDKDAARDALKSGLLSLAIEARILKESNNVGGQPPLDQSYFKSKRWLAAKQASPVYERLERLALSLGFDIAEMGKEIDAAAENEGVK